MKKTLIAMLIAGTSVSAFAGSNFSNDFIKVERSSITSSENIDVENTTLTLSSSLTKHIFVEAKAGLKEADNKDTIKKIITYGAFLGAETPLQVSHNASVFIKAGLFKEKMEFGSLLDNWPNLDRDYVDAQVGLRWDYGLPRLDMKIYIGIQKFKSFHADSNKDKNIYYGIDVNYFITKNLTIGGKLIKNQASKAENTIINFDTVYDSEEMGFNISYHW